MAIIAAVAVPSLGLASHGPEGSSKSYVPPVMREAETPQAAIFTLPVPPKILDGPPPVLRRSEQEYPAEFRQDSVAYRKPTLVKWRQSNAAGLPGVSFRQRPSVDDEDQPNEVIYAYCDPRCHYREFELDFEGAPGKLRTVFAYPQKMSWQEFRRAYGSSVSTAGAGGGRTSKFLLKPPPESTGRCLGNVISPGIY